MRCDHCRHWKAPDDVEHYITRFVPMGRCSAIRERWRVMDEATEGRELGWADGENDWDEFGNEPPPPNSWSGVRMEALKAAKAVVQDGSDYRAELLTKADFFCALYEIKS